jgi:hypothetical protein
MMHFEHRLGDGDKQARFTGESAKKTVKTIRTGNAGHNGRDPW